MPITALTALDLAGVSALINAAALPVDEAKARKVDVVVRASSSVEADTKHESAAVLVPAREIAAKPTMTTLARAHLWKALPTAPDSRTVLTEK